MFKQKWSLLFSIAVGLSSMAVHAQGNFCGFQCPLSRFPNTVNLFNAIQESSRHTPQVCNERLASLFQNQDVEPVSNARRLMALTYGSCEVLSQPVRSRRTPEEIPSRAISFDSLKREFSVNRDLVLENHPYLQKRRSSSCNDVKACESNLETLGACEQAACMALSHPPLYQFNQRLRDHSPFERVRKGETEALGMGDASFISEVFSMAELSNEELWSLGNRDCFDRILGQVGIKPGDVIVASKSHSMMIDTIGADPFGIEALRKRAPYELQLNLQAVMKEKGAERSGMISPYHYDLLMKLKLDDVLSGASKADDYLQKAFLDELAQDACEQMLRKPEDYRVTIIHSSPRGGFVGIQREKIFPGLGEVGALSSSAAVFRLKVQADCIQTLRSDWLAQVPASNEKVRRVLKAESEFVSELKKRESEGHGARILRVNSNNDGCKASSGEHPSFEAAQCIRCCPTQTDYDTLVPNESKEVQKW